MGSRSSILDNCGKYSEDLNEISKKVIEQKNLNGEKITERDFINVDDEIFQAYQTILTNLNDGESITDAIRNLKNDVLNRGLTSDFRNLAVSAVQKTIQQRGKNVNSELKVEDTIVKAVATYNLLENSEKILDNVFDEKFVQNMDVVLEKAKNGDAEATAEMETIKKVSKFMATHQTLKGNQDRAVLVYMERLSHLNTPMANELLEKMANQYGDVLDVFDMGEDGKKVINIEKIQNALSERITPERAEKLNVEDINMRLGEKTVKKGVYTGKDAPEDAKAVISDMKKSVFMSEIRKIMKQYMKSEDERKKIEELYGKYPEEMREFLRNEVDICNKIQETGKGMKALTRHQSTVMILNDVIHSKEEKMAEMPKTKLEPKKAPSRESDDGLEL